MRLTFRVAVFILVMSTVAASEADWREKPTNLEDMWRDEPVPLSEMIGEEDTMDWMEKAKEDPIGLFEDICVWLYNYVEEVGFTEEMDRAKKFPLLLLNKFPRLRPYAEKINGLALGCLIAGAAIGGVPIQVIVIIGLAVFQFPLFATLTGLATLTGIIFRWYSCDVSKNAVRNGSGYMITLGLMALVVIAVMTQMEMFTEKNLMLWGLTALFVILVGVSGYTMSHSAGKIMALAPVGVALFVLLMMGFVAKEANFDEFAKRMRYGIITNGATEAQKIEYMYNKGALELARDLDPRVTVSNVMENQIGAPLKDIIGSVSMFTPRTGTSTVPIGSKATHHPILLFQNVTYSYQIWCLVIGVLCMGYEFGLRSLQKDVSVKKFYTAARSAYGKDKKPEALTEDIAAKIIREIGWKQVYSVMHNIDRQRALSMLETFLYGWCLDGVAMGLFAIVVYHIGYYLLSVSIWVPRVGRSWLIHGKTARENAELALSVDVSITGYTDPMHEARTLLAFGPLVSVVLMGVGLLNTQGYWMALALMAVVIFLCVHGMSEENCNFQITLAMAIGCGYWSQFILAMLEFSAPKKDYWLRTDKPMRAIY